MTPVICTHKIVNLIGSPRHVKKCLRVGVDIICAQGTEAGAHTGDISTMVLLPQVVDLCRAHDVLVVGAGGIYDGTGDEEEEMMLVN